MKIVQIGDTENIYLLTKGQGELILLTEKNIEQAKGFGAPTLSKLTMKNVRELEDMVNPKNKKGGKDEEDPDDPLSSKDIVIKLRSFFVRRSNIYLEETND